jgi:two-component system nitrate/nitrite response regulator NarL
MTFGQNRDSLLTPFGLTSAWRPRKFPDHQAVVPSATQIFMGTSAASSVKRTTMLFLIVENRMLREVMTDIFHRQSEFCVVGSVRFGESSLEQLRTSRAEIILCDQASAASFPNDFISDFLRSAPGRSAILFDMDDDFEAFLRAVRSGSSGYLLGDASAEDMINAVRRVTSGEAVCPPRLCHELIQFVARSTLEGSMILNRRLCSELGLTPRQQQLAALLARGFTNKEIAASLRVSEFTVKNHVHRIMRRLNAHSRYAAVQTLCDRNPTFAP